MALKPFKLSFLLFSARSRREWRLRTMEVELELEVEKKIEMEVEVELEVVLEF